MNEKAQIKKKFPRLKGPLSFKVTSPITMQYNCIAWAAGVDNQWWWPIAGKFWPAAAPLELTIDAFIAAYATVGYSVCNNATLEAGYEKIALYVDSGGLPTHAARQLPSGQWTSKLGPAWDISHQLTSGLEGSEYGNVARYLKRKVI